MPRKNTIIITIDSLRFDAISAYEPDDKNKRVFRTKPRTKPIDWLAEKGTIFTNCITTAPYTTAAHASIITGKWPGNNGLQVYFKNPIQVPTVFQMLSNKRFKTLLFTDFPVILGNHLGFTRGVDSYIAYDEVSALKKMSDFNGDRHFSLFHFAGAHFPYGFNKIKGKERELSLEIQKLSNIYDIELPTSLECSFVETERDPNEELLAQQFRFILLEMWKKELYREILELYIKGLNKFIFERFEPFLEKLVDLGFLDNSLVVICGDHGEEYNQESRGHFNLSEGAIRVPLIFTGEAVDVKRKVSKQVRLIDILPTALDWLGLDNLVSRTDGISLLEPEIVPESLKAFTQLWYYDMSSAIGFQHKTITTGELPPYSFPSFLEKESLRLNNVKLIKTYGPKSKRANAKLYDVSEFERQIFDKKIKNYYNKQLVKFNKSTRFNSSGVTLLSKPDKEALRCQLISLGYNLGK